MKWRSVLPLTLVGVLLTMASPPALADATSLSLAQALELARRCAPEIRAARASAALQAAQAASARSAYYPGITAQGTGQGSFTEGTQPLPPPAQGVFSYSNYSAGGQGAVTLQWLVYDFGHTPNAVATQDAQHASALATVAATKLTVESDAANAYITLAYAEKLREVLRATVARRERLALLARAMVRQGLQPPLEEMRAFARAEASRVDLATAEGAVADTRCVLAALVGLDSASSLHVWPPRFAVVDASPQAAIHDSARLPSIAAADAMVESYRSAIAAARAQYLPALSLQANGSYGVTRYNTSDIPYTTVLGTGSLVVSVPVFEAALAPAVDVAQANENNAQATADQARRDAREEAARAAAGVASAEVRLEHARRAAESSAGVLAIVQARYVQGLSSPIELIDAENADDTARVWETQAEQAHAQAVVRLLVATGRKIEEAQ